MPTTVTDGCLSPTEKSFQFAGRTTSRNCAVAAGTRSGRQDWRRRPASRVSSAMRSPSQSSCQSSTFSILDLSPIAQVSAGFPQKPKWKVSFFRSAKPKVTLAESVRYLLCLAVSLMDCLLGHWAKHEQLGIRNQNHQFRANIPAKLVSKLLVKHYCLLCRPYCSVESQLKNNVNTKTM